MNKIFLLTGFYLIIFVSYCDAAIFIYQDTATNKVNITNKLQEEANNRFIENFDKYKLIYAAPEELEELRRTFTEGITELAENIEIRFDKIFALASKDYFVDFYLLKAVAKSISAFNVEYSENDRIGIMGIKKDWSDSALQQIQSPEINIRIAAKRLRDLLLKFDYDISLALSAYYLSPQDVYDELNNSGDLPRDKKCRIFFNNTMNYYREYRTQSGSVSSINRKIQKDGKTILFNTIQE